MLITPLKHGCWKLAFVLSLAVSAPSFVPTAAAAPAGPERWEKTIRAWEEADKTNPPPKGATLFTGASNLRRWESLATDLKGQKVINRAFGGSQMKEVLHFIDRLVFPLAPKEIVLQAGGNDLKAGRTPEETIADFKAFVAKVHAGLPQTRITVLSIPPSPARWDQREAMVRVNQAVKQIMEGDERCSYIDLFPPMLGTDGKPREELFVEDRLHVNAAGYELWTSLLKWDREIKALLAKDKATPPPQNAILFLGSSSIKRWTNVAKDFPNHQVVNHGFGGSHIFDSLALADQLILPCAPKQIIFYAGGNDLNSGKSTERVLGDFQALVKKVHATLPQTRIAFISIAGNPKRWAQVEEVKKLNHLVEAFTKTDPRLAFINVFPAMLGADGLPLPDIFVSDQLHMNAKGYAIWTKVVAPYLK
ncbi:MAG: hypothetical protein HZA89_00195 [Verrucomicrobia bacterium]|nr:hypothetical protein [Verrucomicrobiota bacterium]